MGCFSFVCKVCDKPIICDRDIAEEVTLYWLKDGKVHQQMTGNYDSYGRVTPPNSTLPIQWTEEGLSIPETWSKVCEDMFDKNPENGIAAIHTKCNIGLIPTTKSDDDPNQGWIVDEPEESFWNNPMEML